MANPRVKFPGLLADEMTRRPYDVMNKVVQQARWEIQAAEDVTIFEALDAGNYCFNPEHPGHGGHISDCDHPDCVSKVIHES